MQAGNTYTIADIAICPVWSLGARRTSYPGSAEFLDVASYTHLKDWVEKIAQRPAAQRGLTVKYQSMDH